MIHGTDGRILCPMFKMAVGIICLVLSCEYLYTYCVYEMASFGILIIGDSLPGCAPRKAVIEPPASLMSP
jgi:hypothetical protein